MNSLTAHLDRFALNYERTCYLYSKEVILRQIALLKSAFPEPFRILYSLKANSYLPIVKIMVEQGLWCDVASPAEFNIAKAAGISPKHISVTGPGKTIKEIDFFLDEGAGFINAESEMELNYLLSQQDSRTKKLARVAWPEHHNQFGLEINDMWSDKIDGLHSFGKSQILNSKELLIHFEKTIDLALELKKKGSPPKFINFGSGIGIPYHPHEFDFDLEQFSQDLNLLLERKQLLKHLPDTTFLVESGRFLVGQSGFYLTKVLYKKNVHGKTIIITDGGFYQFMAASSVGQLLRRPFPIAKLGLQNNETEVVTIAGKSCSPLDIFATDITLPVLSEGDVIAIGNAGAYGLAYSPVHFCRSELPVEIIF